MTICVCGMGRAGSAMVQKILETEEIQLSCVLSRSNSIHVGRDVGDIINKTPLDVKVFPIGVDIDILKDKNIDVIIDFSSNAATMQLLEICKKTGAKLVVCTTNHLEEMIIEMEEEVMKNRLGVVYAPNLTLGINILIDFVSTISRILTDFDFEIVEYHFKNKPKVTATADIIAKAIGREEVPISSVRIGGYVGVHEVYCANESERLTIIHESFSRKAFANGAILAANFIKDKNGFYHMSDVIEEIKKAL